MRLAAALLCGLALASLAGCGGDGPPPRSDGVFVPASKEEERAMDAALLGSSETPEDGRLDTTNHLVDGDRGRVRLTVSIAVDKTPVRARGTVDLAREHGEWRVADYGLDFMRDLLVNGFGGAFVNLLAETGTVDERLRRAYSRCLEQRVRETDDDTLRTHGEALLRGDGGRHDGLRRLAFACITDAPGGRAWLRARFEAGVRKAIARANGSTTYARCVVARLRSTTSDAFIADERWKALSEAPVATERLQARVGAAARFCSGE